MNEVDIQILKLIDILKFLKKIPTDKSFCDSVKLHTSTLTNIKNEKQHFTVHHIKLICEVYDVNANWIFKIEKNQFNTAGNVDITDIPEKTLTAI